MQMYYIAKNEEREELLAKFNDGSLAAFVRMPVPNDVNYRTLLRTVGSEVSRELGLEGLDVKITKRKDKIIIRNASGEENPTKILGQVIRLRKITNDALSMARDIDYIENILEMK